MNKNSKKVANILKNGGIVIYPTDTAFGIGCRIDNDKAVDKLFRVRRRPKEKAVPVLISSIKMAKEYVNVIDPSVDRLMRKYWPGGLTIVLKRKTGKVSDRVSGGSDTIGVRIPRHRTIRELIRKVGVPIVGSSANFSGEKTPYKFSDLNPNLVKRVDSVLSGRCSFKKASTVIDVTKKPWRILREGAIEVKFT